MLTSPRVCRLVLSILSLLPVAAAAQTAPTADDPPGIGRPPGKTSLPVVSTLIPMTDGAMMVSINGSRPLKLFFDSGANAVILKPAVQDELRLPAIGRGTVGTRVSVDTLTAGDLTLSSFAAVVIDAANSAHLPFDGVIGLTLFQDVTIAWSPSGGDMEVSRTPLTAGTPNTYAYQAAAHGRLVTLPIRIGGRELDAVLDIGSHAGVIVPSILAATLPLTIDKTRTIRLGGPGIAPSTGHPATLEGAIAIGTLVVDKPSIVVADITHADGARSQVVNIGRPVLRHARLTVDQRSHLVRIEPLAAR